jgi:G patch domain-containing protein 1
LVTGLPALHGILNPVKETIGVKLLRSMGWRPNQGTGERITNKEKKERRKRAEKFKSYGCILPPGLTKPSPGSAGEGSESEEDSGHLFAPDDIPTFTVQPKENTFGLGYSGLLPRASSASTSKSHFVLFEPTLSLKDKNKKLQIKGQAFGVGAFETEDADIYAKDDMSQYDFELGPGRKEKKSSKMLALPAPDLLDGFIRAAKRDPSVKMYQLPDVPRDWVPIHRNKKSRFDVKPLTENELKGLGRHDLNAYQRAVILEEVLDAGTQSTTIQEVKAVETVEHVKSVQLNQKSIEQQIATFDFDSLLSQVKMGVAKQKAVAASALPPDPEREMKRAELKKFVEGSVKATTFQPFAKEPEKQFRFDAFNVLSKCGRMAEFSVLYPDIMTEWEREREKVNFHLFSFLGRKFNFSLVQQVEFERALELYRPLCGMMQTRFQSGGHVEENIQGGLVAQLDSLVTRETPSKPVEVKERDPAKRAAHRKHFGPLTRQRSQWKPDRLLCIRFNIPNPFPT